MEVVIPGLAPGHNLVGLIFSSVLGLRADVLARWWRAMECCLTCFLVALVTWEEIGWLGGHVARRAKALMPVSLS
jgi:hypothetical protein